MLTKNIFFRLPLISALLAFLILIKKNLFFSNFNIDEVILFSAAKADSLTNVLMNNRDWGSLDPGGFTSLLHSWALFSTEAYWLRFLPVLFSFLCCVLLISSVKRMTRDKMLCYLPILFFVSSDYLLNHSFQVRSYAMELCGHAFLFYLLSKIEVIKESDWKKLTFYSLGIVLFLSSRYLLWVNFIALIMTLFITKEVKSKKLSLTILVLPLASIIFYSLFSLKYQIARESSSYLDSLFIFKNSFNYFLKNFFNFTVLSYFTYPLFLLIRGNLSTLEKRILVYLCIYFLGLVSVDILGISPLNTSSSYALGLHILSLCSLSLMTISLISHKHSPRVVSILISFSIVIASGQYWFKQRSNIVEVLRYTEKNLTHLKTVGTDPNSYRIIRFLKDEVKLNINWDKLPAFVEEGQEGDAFIRTNLLPQEQSALRKDFISLAGCHYQQIFVRRSLIQELPNEYCLRK